VNISREFPSFLFKVIASFRSLLSVSLTFWIREDWDLRKGWVWGSRLMK